MNFFIREKNISRYLDFCVSVKSTKTQKSITKTQKSRYLDIFFSLIKKFINYTLKATYFMVKNSFVIEATFNIYNFNIIEKNYIFLT